ncbi:MAG: hypothetical protein ALAOOOJD_00551 [bacterium]|nr:hypothetical protein [bacterium]
MKNRNWREYMPNLMDRITVIQTSAVDDPCIREMRIRVIDVLDLFAASLSADQILDEMPDLEREDLQACLQFARRRLDHPLVLA